MIRLLILASFFGLFGQKFEVASIRPQAPDDHTFFVRPPNRGQFTANGTVAKLLVMLAYDVQESQLTGGPAWFATEKWDIQAKSENDQHDVNETRLMLQQLLADRFGLRLHRSTEQRPVYVLTVNKGGPKFKASEATRMDLQVGRNSIFLRGGTIDRLTAVLSTALGRPVVDRTGLMGNYDITVQWDDAPVRDGGLPGTADSPSTPAAASAENDRGSIFSAISDQLGLRLEAQRGPVDVLVIDDIKRPSPN
jgi:uncharacterized protein (TIGR03435 family)